jgi:hypothetical protein
MATHARQLTDSGNFPIPVLGSQENRTITAIASNTNVAVDGTAKTYTLSSGTWTNIPAKGSVIVWSGFTEAVNNDGHFVISANSTVITVAEPLTTEAAGDTVTGTIHPDGRSHGQVTLTTTTASYITGLKEEEIYEFALFGSPAVGAGASASAPSENICFRPGGYPLVQTVTTASMIWPNTVRTLQVKLQSDQQSIGFIHSDTTTANSSVIAWRRLY